MNHLSIGLEARDRVNHAIGGGIPEGSLVLVEGGTGAGKSVLTARLVYGLCEEGTSVGCPTTSSTTCSTGDSGTSGCPPTGSARC